MIAGKIFAAKFPQCGIEIPNVNDVARGFAYLYAIPYPERLANENVNPGDKAFHRRLDSETDDNRADTERGNRGIPIDKNYRNDNDCDNKANCEMLDTLECKARGRVLDMSKPIDRRNACDSEHDYD